jgi:hypothetical protein
MPEFMNNPDRDEVKLKVTIINPLTLEKTFTMTVAGSLWNYAMAPMPKDYDCPLTGYQQGARDQLMARHKLCQGLGKAFADELLMSIKRQDPKNGYFDQKGGA